MSFSFFFKTIFKPLSTNVRRSCIGRDTFFFRKNKIMYIKRPLMLSLLWRKRETSKESRLLTLVWFDYFICSPRPRALDGNSRGRFECIGGCPAQSTAEEMKIKVEISTFSSSYSFFCRHPWQRQMNAITSEPCSSPVLDSIHNLLWLPFSRSSLASFSVGADQPRHFCSSRCFEAKKSHGKHYLIDCDNFPPSWRLSFSFLSSFVVRRLPLRPPRAVLDFSVLWCLFTFFSLFHRLAQWQRWCSGTTSTSHALGVVECCVLFIHNALLSFHIQLKHTKKKV